MSLIRVFKITVFPLDMDHNSKISLNLWLVWTNTVKP